MSLFVRRVSQNLGLMNARRNAAMAFSTSAMRRTDYSSHHGNDPEVLEKGKQEALEEQKRGEGEWKQDLASDSEAFVKAQREEIKAAKEDVKELQKITKELMNEKSSSNA